VREAGRIYERALRYLPDDAASTAGLARALALAGRPRRALALLERAVALSERAGEPDPDALIDLAKTLADTAGDLPQAIARVREVSAASSRLVEARYLEGLWRARLGDRAGAALAFGRLREAIELSAPARPEWSAWLVEAADNALGVDADPVQAERHLATALRLEPRNAEIARRYREAAAQVAKQRR
jgi:tetratricopeptide (TPR) repeat protein